MRSTFTAVLGAAALLLLVSAPAQASDSDHHNAIEAIGNGTEITCGVGATALDDTSIDTSEYVHSYIVTALGANPLNVYLGGAAVATTSGDELAPGMTRVLKFRGKKKPYCISADGAQKVRVVEVAYN